MANSRIPRLLDFSGSMCLVPSRTLGPVGWNDQGDPNVTTQMGDTPGPLGNYDWADPTLHSMGGVGWMNGGICSDVEGTLLAPGFSLPKPFSASAGQISLDTAQEMALKISTYFEGGKSMNYQALAGDFDGQGTSFGLIQWNFGQNTLGPLLKKMMAADASAFAACFDANADFAKLKKALENNSPSDQLMWARAVQKDRKAAWKASFNAIGANEAFNLIQRQEALAAYHPLAMVSIMRLRKISPALMQQVEFRSYAALFDLSVQQHGISKAFAIIKSQVAVEKPETQLELMKMVVIKRGKKASSEWASDCISRRMGILTGAEYESTASGITRKRTNPLFSLVKENGSKIVQDI